MAMFRFSAKHFRLALSAFGGMAALTAAALLPSEGLKTPGVTMAIPAAAAAQEELAPAATPSEGGSAATTLMPVTRWLRSGEYAASSSTTARRAAPITAPTPPCLIPLRSESRP
jgi:hypothetical protein